jgi:hypothetical protein
LQPDFRQATIACPPQSACLPCPCLRQAGGTGRWPRTNSLCVPSMAFRQTLTPATALAAHPPTLVAPSPAAAQAIAWHQPQPPPAFAPALDLVAGERVQWQLLARSDLRLVRLAAPPATLKPKNSQRRPEGFLSRINGSLASESCTALSSLWRFAGQIARIVMGL